MVGTTWALLFLLAAPAVFAWTDQMHVDKMERDMDRAKYLKKVRQGTVLVH